mmetsp:Transcript_12273/g.45479  ORF Transcript_12273/g.45479 Transcript_12273/m.45479 type:complete len:551 (-) Transcript_12273:638-2290(-)
MLRGLLTTLAVLAPAWAAPLDGGVPEQRHLALGVAANVASSNGVAITWITTLGAGSSATVRLSPTSAAEVQSGGGKVYTGQKYDYSYVDERHSVPYQSGDIFRVFITDLEPRTTYWYAVDGAPTDVRAFTTVPAAGDGTKFSDSSVLEIAVMGDLGQTEFSEQTVNRVCPRCATAGSAPIGNSDAAFAIIVGDLAYADGDPERWDEWGRLTEPLASRMPLMFFPGNHEIEIDEDTMVPFVNYRNRYVMSQAQDEIITPGEVFDWHTYDFNFTYEGGSSYYSFDVGRAHFVMLNTYVDTTVDSQQYSWLLNDLTTLNRTTTPWVFAFLHGPWYNSNHVHQNEVATDNSRAAMEPLMEQYDVSMVFSGHVHSYERSHPVFEDVVFEAGQAPIYVVVGDGGNHEGLYSDFSPQHWTAYHNGSSYGHGRIKIFNDSVATWEWFPNHLATAEDSVAVTNLAQRSLQSDDDKKVDTDTREGDILGGTVVVVVFVSMIVAALVVTYRRRKAFLKATDHDPLISSLDRDEPSSPAASPRTEEKSDIEIARNEDFDGEL